MTKTAQTFGSYIWDTPGFEKIKPLLQTKQSITVSGVNSAAKPFITAMLLTKLPLPAIFIASDSCRADNIAMALNFFTDTEIITLTEEEMEDESNLTGIAEKILKKEKFILISDLSVISQKVQSPYVLYKNSISLKTGMNIPIEKIIALLDEKGFRRSYMTEKKKDFSLRGCILDVYPQTAEPIRIEFFGNEIESIRTFNIETQRSEKVLSEAVIMSLGHEEGEMSILGYLNPDSPIIVDEPDLLRLEAMEREPFVLWEEIEKYFTERKVIYLSSWGDEGEINFNTFPIACFNKSLEALKEYINEHLHKTKIIIASSHSLRITQLLNKDGLITDNNLQNIDLGTITILKKNIPEGFRFDDKLTLITDNELFGSRARCVRNVKREIPLKMEDLTPGDFIVHSTHGIGLYHGLQTRNIDKIDREFLEIEYAKGDKLFLPTDQIYLIQKFETNDEKPPSLSKMGGKEWSNTKAKVKEEVEKIAAQLLELYAKREAAQGYAFPPDSPWQQELEESFPFTETPDQQKAITDAKSDMELSKPMERLVCGDAGYGKTEVALRCAFKAAVEGKQVAMLAPTTLLAEQHYNTFTERYAPFPIKTELLSRFRSSAQIKESLSKINSGDVDVIIGTHRLLSKDVKFKNLGLVVIDEEQHFGVIHKERLREFSHGVDTITLSATPIPRTLYLTMSGIRDLSVISTPPQNRRPIKTYIFPFSNEVIKGAITREKERGGQIFFLHNRVNGIESVAKNIQNLIPGIRVATAHGQMSEELLENRIKSFLDGEYDVLVCTTIIQSGIDMPSVNTIIVNNAYGFGLAQLYQIRGRVGRSHHQAYAYLLYPPHRSLTDNAKKRMEILRDFTELGSGFHVAMKDLELRGAGDILGKAQHGFIKTVGFELYCQMLSEAVAQLKGKPVVKELGSPVIELPVPAFIPNSYISDANQKLTIYRRIAGIKQEKEIREIKEELRDRFGPMCEEVYNLLDAAKLKLLLMDMLIPKLSWNGDNLFMLMPFFKGLSKTSMKKMRELLIPFEFENNRLTLYGILTDEYWLEKLTDFLEKLKSVIPKEDLPAAE